MCNGKNNDSQLKDIGEVEFIYMLSAWSHNNHNNSKLKSHQQSIDLTFATSVYIQRGFRYNL